VLGISSSYEKLERASAIGLDAGLNYRDNPDWDPGRSTRPAATAWTWWWKWAAWER